MFISYQTVRTTVVGVATAAVATAAAVFGLPDKKDNTSRQPANTAFQSQAAHADPAAIPQPKSPNVNAFASQPIRQNSQTSTPQDSPPHASPSRRSDPRPSNTSGARPRTAPTLSERYRVAIEIATRPADKSGRGKDVLGAASPWKLNLYDDNVDGQWDRAKLDTNRDDVDDEKWTFKNGRWEKDNGELVWSGNRWAPPIANNTRRSSPAEAVNPYQQAMQMATDRADPSGKGKDVLGPSSPWKLNLYDDNFDGQWDRAKLDTNRDDVDDEKWTFKNGRWEKDEGQTIWNGNSWIAAESGRQAPTNEAVAAAPERSSTLTDTNTQRYRKAMQIAAARADSSGKGKDVLGSRSAWKLNLYDDNRDGQWDRAKLDMNRDDVDDEKWNFKQGRWEKDGGKTIWDGRNWVAVNQFDTNTKRYRAAMQIATSQADPSGKGKDVLGSQSPWKLNLYDDDRDGQWDRAKLDMDRDDVDDEKWNYKQGRWEKDGGLTIWNGDNWVQEQ